MARKALIVKTQNLREKIANALALGKKPKHATKAYHRCVLCGRNHGYMRRFGICRICFREKARQGKIMGVRKSSW